MKTKLSLLGLAVSAALFWPSSGAAQELNWPEQAEARIEAVLKIKREAMRSPGMRSRSENEFGVLGKRAEALMDELAEWVADPAFVAELREAEAGDIRAKIALWAVDRKKRPEEYARFAKWYVNRPSDEDAVEYFSRPHMKPEHLANADPFAGPIVPERLVPRHGTWTPHQIDEEDRIEENRPILEYGFFMPPTGQGFDHDTYRSNLLIALSELGNLQGSLSLFTAESEMLADREDLQGRNNQNKELLAFFFRLPGDTSLRELAKWFSEPDMKDSIATMFKNAWSRRWLFSEYADANRHYLEWIDLAGRDWSEPHEVEFARWLQTVPAPAP